MRIATWNVNSLKQRVPRPLLTNTFGFASARLAIPADPSLAGSTLYAQAFVADPQGAALGLALTAGQRVTLGW